MDNEILFTVEKWTGEIVDIYGPTNEKYGNEKVIEVISSLEHDIMHERRNLIAAAKSDYHVKEIMKETNWKIRVLNEQRKSNDKNTTVELRRSQRIKDKKKNEVKKKRPARIVKFVE
tara:strand:- start:211 stop:561 length:351 start_codon:yes stop_codon:yes gene_type:complete